MNHEYYGHYLDYNMQGKIEIGTGIVEVADITERIPDFMYQADCIFVDPPCSQSNIKSFYTKAGIDNSKGVYISFWRALQEYILKTNPKKCFIEVFKSNFEEVSKFLSENFEHKTIFQSHYNHLLKNTCSILVGHNEPIYEYPQGIDQADFIELICKHEKFDIIGEPCMGRGRVGFYANQNNRKFVGTELNQKRLAVMISLIKSGAKKFSIKGAKK